MKTIELEDNDCSLLGFALAVYIEDTEKKIKNLRKQGVNIIVAQEQLNKVEMLTYTKIIPDSWSGPKPSYWTK